MTTDHEASRTLVKSPPELWAECSDAGSLARHLGEFGDIQITRLEPETIVAWEGERASGTVRIEPSGWGTKVTLTAKAEAHEPEPTAAEPAREVQEPPARAAEEPRPAAEPEEPPAPEPPAPPVVPEPRGAAAARSGLWGRFFGRIRPPAAPPAQSPVNLAAPGPAPEAPPEAPSEPPPAPVVAVPQAPEPEPVAVTHRPDATPVPEASRPEAVLDAALDSLGQAHHRPFSRN